MVCREAAKDVQPFAAAAGNPSGLMALALQTAPKLRQLGNTPGITERTRGALFRLSGALEALGHGAPPSAIGQELSGSAQEVGRACAA
jgi:hypothetical protein